MSTALSALLLCPVTSRCLAFPNSTLHLLNIWILLGSLYLDSLLCAAAQKTLSRQQGGAVIRLTLFASCLSRITVFHCPMSSILKLLFEMSFICFLVTPGRKVKLVLLLHLLLSESFEQSRGRCLLRSLPAPSRTEGFIYTWRFVLPHHL